MNADKQCYSVIHLLNFGKSPQNYSSDQIYSICQLLTVWHNTIRTFHPQEPLNLDVWKSNRKKQQDLEIYIILYKVPKEEAQKLRFPIPCKF